MLYHFTVIVDPGHSWLITPVPILKNIKGLFDQISAYSPIKDNLIYLEEDCDAPLFINELEKAGHTINLSFQNINDFDEYLQNV
jgi:hypothetical protein